MKEKVSQLYRTFVPVFCPYLQTEINFNSKGLNHIFYKRSAKLRSKTEIESRLSILELAPKLLALTTTVQEFEVIQKETDAGELHITYNAFIAIVDKKKICVVVRKLGANGKYHFWSVFPEWVTSEKRDRNLDIIANK